MLAACLALLCAAQDAREPWTSSKLTGSPEPPPPCRVERAWPALTFNKPVHLVPAPGGRFVVVEEKGMLWSVPADPASTERRPFLDLRALKFGEGWKRLQASYAVAFDPDFDRTRACYVMYVLDHQTPGAHPKGSRLSRFKVTADLAADPATEEILLEWLAGGHNGCDLRFGPDGMLYLSAGDGDRPSPPDPRDTGQDLGDLLSSILRLDVRGKSAAAPPDNPFVGREGIRPEIWAYGFRNPWRMAFDRATGRLWTGDVGWERWELVFCVEKGGNYGWSVMEGPTPCRPDARRGPTPILPAAHAIPHPESASITGGFVYRGKALKGLEGRYLYGDWETRRVWANPVDGVRLGERTEIARTPLRVVAFAEDAAGEPLLVDHEAGGLWKLVPNEAPDRNADFPRTISATGLFADAAAQTPSRGVLPFEINAARWADGALGSRWLAIPGTGTPSLIDKNREWPRESSWPKDSVFAKTLNLGARKVETQILHFDGLNWNAYAYAWDAAQKDATLVGAAGAELDLGGGRRWRVLPRAACLTCHNPWQGYALSFHPAQLDRGGQLERLEKLGYLPATKRGPPRVDPTDAARPLETRARSWLAVNCAHCHRFGGGGSALIDLRHDLPLAEAKLVGVRPHLGDFALPDPHLVSPGAPDRSALLFRLAKLGPGHMPYLGSDDVDPAGLELLRAWIASLGARAARPELERLRGGELRAVDELLATTSGALDLALAVEGLGPEAKSAAISRALALPPGPVRELFERFEPREKRRKRLGLVIHPGEILGLQGDAERGRLLFESPGLQCAVCHRPGADAVQLGAPLNGLSARASKGQILDSILDPSRTVDPKFTGLRVQTRDGRVLAGVLASRDDRDLVLRDARGSTRIPLASIEREAKLDRSLMPDNLLQSLTAQEAADLLEYVATLK
jgi:putative heme-binding domain-containing protein